MNSLILKPRFRDAPGVLKMALSFVKFVLVGVSHKELPWRTPGWMSIIFHPKLAIQGKGD